MTKRINKKLGVSRRLGVSLWGHKKDPFLSRNYPPGVHGTLGYRRSSDYGVQLLAKQKLRKYYGNITEKQFRIIYSRAERMRGDTSQNLIGLLESRLDAFVYRSGFVPTVFAARQFVNHKHITVNNKVVNIPSYSLKAGDVVEIRDRSKQLGVVLSAISSRDTSGISYVELDDSRTKATFVHVPVLENVPYATPMDPQMVVELYSK